MSPSPPRKPRSGRRQFPSAPPPGMPPGIHPGTDQQWDEVMNSPGMQRALQNPAIAQALYQHMQTNVPGGVSSVMPPPGGQRPLRFQSGGNYAGLSYDDQIQELEKESNQSSTTPQRRGEIALQVAKLQQAKLQQDTQPSTPITLGTAKLPTSGLSQLTGPPTLGNTLGPMALGALAGAGATKNQGLAALLSAGLAGGVSYLVRKYGAGSQRAQAAQAARSRRQQQDTGYDSGYPASASAPATPPPPPQGTPGLTTGVPGMNLPLGSQPSIDIAGASGSTPPPGPGLWTATANSDSGNLISYNGKDWVDARTKKPFSGAMANVTQVDNLADTSPATTPPPGDLGITPAYMQDPSLTGLGTVGLAEGGPVEPPAKDVLRRKPMGMAVPVLHTTIVIAAKPKKEKKPEKKRVGGPLVARRPGAIPPRHGPGDGRPLPHGRVQVPRGSGAAIRGKRFGGIY